MSPEIRCIIIDDEPKAIELLQERLNILFPNIQIKGTFTDWRKGLEVLRSEAIDLLFLDVSMPEKSGIDFLKLFPSIPFQVIFVTAHTEFALQAIKFSAAGYVLKPVDDYELSFAVNKALENIKGTSNNSKTQHQLPNNAIKIGIPNVKGIDYLNAEDILYFESVNKYTKVVTKNTSIMSSYNLGEFKKVIDENDFYQVHRSYIVNIHHIKRYEIAGVLIMEDNMQIPVSKNVRTDFVNMFNTINRTAGFKQKDSE
ncbi:LytR/AlgR family response regulator transcription factor [Polluticoccus soli]|uniref:LytR/AlgR family response regulator transcription factor n=1 Tax=Polluticoccus soli TaxID=3034150 RepID=UPI0023E109BC|nr:LytTR family DNA-binding domain-containing protein [Flavipsychrobacter sp. JY13-12]